VINHKGANQMEKYNLTISLLNHDNIADVIVDKAVDQNYDNLYAVASRIISSFRTFAPAPAIGTIQIYVFTLNDHGIPSGLMSKIIVDVENKKEFNLKKLETEILLSLINGAESLVQLQKDLRKTFR